MDTLFQDLRYGARMLMRNRAFTFVAVIALALGIGANTAIFSIVYSILLKPLPYKDADRLAVANISVPDYRDLIEANQVFDETALWASNLYSFNANGEAEQVLGAVVSPSFFTILGQAATGRVFEPKEASEALVVLSYDLWQRRFGGETSAIGRTIELGGRIHEIIGVMPKEFQFPSSQFKLWVPFDSAMSATPQQAKNRQLRIFRVLAHLKPGVSLVEAQAEASAISERLEQQYPDTNAGSQIRFTALYERIVGDARPALLVLFCAVGLVLLIACANVANLMLARTTTREREIAIRSALGAGRWRVSRQLLTESVLLSAIGGTLGVLLAFWGIDALKALSPGDVPRLDAIGISLPVLLFTFGVSLLTGVLFGLAPALQASRVNLNHALKEGGRGLSGNRWGRRLRGGLVAGEIALSLIVLIGAGLLIKSFAQLVRSDAGFVAENLTTMNLELFRLKDPQRRVVVARDIVSRLEQIPGVQAVGASTGLPPVTPQRGTRFAIEGKEIEPGEDGAYFIAITANYFRALRTPLIEGRAFTDADTQGAELAVIINQSLARRLFPNESPVGKHLKLINPEQSGDWRAIVGVVGDVKYSGLDDTAEAAIYTPFAQTPFLWAYVMIRTETDAAGLTASIRSAVSSADPNLSAVNLQPMSQLVSESVARPRFQMMLLSVFALLALILATVGLYGVMSYLVTQRTREIGVRMALGASSSDVLKMIVRQGMTLAAVGCALGIGGALVATRLMSSLLYGVSATDPATFAAISLLLLAVALGACFVPARKAIKVDPMVALRYE